MQEMQEVLFEQIIFAKTLLETSSRNWFS